MPGLALPNHESANNGCGISYPAEQMCGQQSKAQLPHEEELTPKESFALYCKPVELYNIIRQRTIEKPPSLRRCLRYKIEAKQKKRIQILVSISGSTNTQLPAHGIFPLHVLLARSSKDVPVEGHSPMYWFSRACLLTSFSEPGESDHTKATFTIPDMKSLATSQVCNLNIILISCGQGGQNLSENCLENHMEYSSQKPGGQCFWGKIPIDLLGSSLDCTTLSLGRTVELTSEISMNPGFIEPSLLEHDSCLTFCSLKANATGSFKLQASIDVQEAGARDMRLSPYNIYSYDDVPLPLLPKIIRLRTGNVLFNYKYHKNNLHKSEVTEDFSCSFCLAPCGSFKGLQCHLTSSHDLFRFEFWVSKEYQAVNVSLKIDTRREELLTIAGNDPGNRVFFYRSRFKRCRISKTTTEKTKDVHPPIMEPGSPGMTVPVDQGTNVPEASIDPHPTLHVSNHSELTASIDSHPALPVSNHSEPTALQSDKTRKLPVDPDDPSLVLLKKREFFHSQKAQRMEMEDLYSDHDSEDELDHDIADLEDMTLLGGFSDVAKDEKRIMHMWNSFKRKQRIIADGHVPWACEAFTQHHGKELLENSSLRWCWRLLMIKLWNHGLLNGRTMDTCNKHLDSLASQSADPKQS